MTTTSPLGGEVDSRASAAGEGWRLLPLLAFVLLATILAATTAHAAGPHLVDDGGVVDPGACELEAYFNTSLGPGWRRVLSPTCGFAGLRGWEIGAIIASDGPQGSLVPGIAGKAALVTKGPVQLGVEASAGFDPEGNQADYVSTNLAASLTALHWLVLHGNAGLDHAPGRGVFPTWGLGATAGVARTWWLTAEAAGRQGFRTRWQAGLRHIIGRWQFDAMVSHAIDEARADKWVTLGVVYSFRR